jgi:quercetin dioxygenase-like cupin family protein
MSPTPPLLPLPADKRPVYAVAGGNHVTLLLDRESTASAFDVIDVLAQPGGGPPPHRHAFGEWFHVGQGELTISEERDGTVVCTHRLTAGDSVYVPPWTIHGTLNLSGAPARFQVIGQPGAMTGYFAGADVPVAAEHTPRGGYGVGGSASANRFQWIRIVSRNSVTTRTTLAQWRQRPTEPGARG